MKKIGEKMKCKRCLREFNQFEKIFNVDGQYACIHCKEIEEAKKEWNNKLMEKVNNERKKTEAKK